MLESKFEASIGTSRECDARKAGRDVARSTIEKLKSPPNLFLLFSTIHYKKHDGFEEFLNGVWDVLPEGTPLAGGTIAGFINNQGCFSRGATALAISYPNIDVAIGFGQRAKRNPKKAGRICANMVERQLKNSSYKNKFLIDIISAPIIPKIPFTGEINNIKSKLLGKFFSYIGMPLAHYFGTGIGKEQDVLEQLAAKLPDYNIIGGSSVDDGRMLSNYQFIGDKILSNSVVALGACIDLQIMLKKVVALNKTNKKFEITHKMYHDYIIKKIENKPATEYFLNEILEIPPELFYTLGPFYYKTSDYFPMTFEENEDRVLGVGCFLGNHILLSHKVAGKYVIMCSTNGRQILKTMDSFFSYFSSELPFLFVSSSTIYSFILRNHIFDMKKIIDDKIGKIPYLVIQPMIEHIYDSEKNPAVRAYSTNAFSLLDKSSIKEGY